MKWSWQRMFWTLWCVAMVELIIIVCALQPDYPDEPVFGCNEQIFNTGGEIGPYCVTAVLKMGSWVGQTYADSNEAYSVFNLLSCGLGTQEKFEHGGWAFRGYEMQLVRFNPPTINLADSIETLNAANTFQYKDRLYLVGEIDSVVRQVDSLKAHIEWLWTLNDDVTPDLVGRGLNLYHRNDSITEYDWRQLREGAVATPDSTLEQVWRRQAQDNRIGKGGK